MHTVDGRLAYALPNLEQVLSYYAVFLLVDWLAAVIAFLMEGDEDKSLTWSIFVQRFAYRQVMYWVVVRSFAAALSGRLQGWGKLERKATVSLPERRRRIWARFGELVLRRRRLHVTERIPAILNVKSGSAEEARKALESNDEFEVHDVEPDAIASTIKDVVDARVPQRVLVSGGDGTIATAATALLEDARGARDPARRHAQPLRA